VPDADLVTLAGLNHDSLEGLEVGVFAKHVHSPDRPIQDKINHPTKVTCAVRGMAQIDTIPATAARILAASPFASTWSDPAAGPFPGLTDWMRGSPQPPACSPKRRSCSSSSLPAALMEGSNHFAPFSSHFRRESSTAVGVASSYPNSVPQQGQISNVGSVPVSPHGANSRRNAQTLQRNGSILGIEVGLIVGVSVQPRIGFAHLYGCDIWPDGVNTSCVHVSVLTHTDSEIARPASVAGL
jgi:hypothetical protein